MANVAHFTKHKVIEAIHAGRGLAKATARLLGCDPSVVRRWVKVDPEVANAMEQAKEDVKDEMEHVLQKLALQGQNLEAIKFYLKAKAKERGYTDLPAQTNNSVIDLWLEEMSKRSAVTNETPLLIEDQPILQENR